MKKVVAVGLILGGLGVGYYLYNQKKEVEAIIDGLKIRLERITNLRADFNSINADIYLKIINPVDKELVFDTKFLTAKQLRVYDSVNNRQIAVTNLDSSKLEILKRGIFYLPKMEVSIPVLTGANILLDAISKKQTDFTKRLRFELDLEAFGEVVTFNFNNENNEINLRK